MIDEKDFVYDSLIYQGGHHKTIGIVLDFVKKLDDFLEYFVYADSWYGREELALQLHKLGFRFTIACKSNNPTYLFSQSLHLGLKKHFFRAASRELEPEIIALSFHDNKTCNFISNQFGTRKKFK